MKRWRLTRKARTDLADIWNYTADLWGVVQAERYIRQIETELTAASQGAALARPIDAFWRVKSGHHVCIFRKLSDGDIEVIRILHERMDIDRHL
ncbi:type II toxin-antitoxin system RelE/ParE family toxin [Sphingomonas ursincola]|jgi:toxin ParE1/3/4|uniref:type II toxin-antitoxin system RelE/ParE family toxin n=1 Tax=Sphingomonas ursincola TaxID=56361 RepID=UPI002352B574|nr:type II toxin-antitoxin system RelE/ParE family toxin [Sphingomonas ursincola]MBY0619753.1 type II toxin-antitoxin system RelE/ParE family toxin [Sphingomonas ursincola]